MFSPIWAILGIQIPSYLLGTPLSRGVGTCLEPRRVKIPPGCTLRGSSLKFILLHIAILDDIIIKRCDLWHWHAVIRLVSVSAFIISIACSSTVGPLQKVVKTFIRRLKSVWFLQAWNKLVWSCAYKWLSGIKPIVHNNARCAWTGMAYRNGQGSLKTELSLGEKRRLILPKTIPSRLPVTKLIKAF